MRELKFRAWIKNQMIYCYNELSIFFYNNSDGITMQFTGLRDKNGKEIYEGDIVENYAFRDVVIFEKGIFTTKGSTRNKFDIKQPLAVHLNIKIIGNIYKNPELLESTSNI